MTCNNLPLYRMVGSAAVAASYGIRVRDKDDPYILTAEAALNGLTAAQFPGRFLVEVLPILKYVPAWVPGAEFKRLGAIWAKKCRDMVELPFAQVKRDRSVCPSSFHEVHFHNPLSS